MFEVRLKYKLDEDPDMKFDKILYEIAGRESDWCGHECNCKNPMRDHGWDIENFQDAVAMKNRLRNASRLMFSVVVTVQEKMSFIPTNESETAL